MLVLSGRIGEAVKEDVSTSGPPVMRHENGATSRSDHAVIGFLLLDDAADGVGVVSRGRGVRYEIAGLGRYDGGERNHEKHPGNDAREPCLFEAYSRSASARRSHGVQHGSGEPLGHASQVPRPIRDVGDLPASSPRTMGAAVEPLARKGPSRLELRPRNRPARHGSASTTHIIAARMLRQLLCAMGRRSIVTPRGRMPCAARPAERSHEPIIADRPRVSGRGARAMDRRIMVPHDEAMESKHALWWALTIPRTANCLTSMHLRGIDRQMGGCHRGVAANLDALPMGAPPLVAALGASGV